MRVPAFVTLRRTLISSASFSAARASAQRGSLRKAFSAASYAPEETA